MTIEHKDFYHGAALTQIAKHPLFTAINVIEDAAHISRSAFRVNEDVGIYLKYCIQPKEFNNEYQFTFNRENIAELTRLETLFSRVFIIFVCVHDRQICSLPLEQFNHLLTLRRENIEREEDQYTIIASLQKRKGFQVYVNASGVRKRLVDKAITIPRSDFPKVLFE